MYLESLSRFFRNAMIHISDVFCNFVGKNKLGHIKMNALGPY